MEDLAELLQDLVANHLADLEVQQAAASVVDLEEDLAVDSRSPVLSHYLHSAQAQARKQRQRSHLALQRVMRKMIATMSRVMRETTTT